MRVDLVITELFVGGAEKCLTELAIGLQRHGDVVRVFSIASLPVGDQALLVNRLLEAGIPVASADADRATDFFRAYRKLKRWFRGDGLSPPEVCQAFLFHANVMGTFAARGTKIPVTVGGLRVAEDRPLRCVIEANAVAKMDELICVSEATRDFATERLRARPERTTVIGNSVDVDRFRNTPPMPWSRIGWPDDSVVSLFVGRFHPQKGIDLLQSQIDAIAPPDTDRRLLLVGDGPLRTPLIEWARSIGESRVRILPWQKDVAPLMRSARLLVLPSRYEGMPNVVLEAMAAERPVVCSRIEGSQELFAHRDKEQVFAPEDASAMSILVRRLQQDEELAVRIGRQNLDHVRSDFSVDAMVRRYRARYASLRDRTGEIE